MFQKILIDLSMANKDIKGDLKADIKKHVKNIYLEQELEPCPVRACFINPPGPEAIQVMRLPP